MSALSPLTYGSVCSGIEAASVAWLPLGWRAAFLSEIDAFPRAVLQHHYPDVPLHGDFTTIEAGQYEPIRLLVGGTPCQSFSVAGLRGGLADDRGNLALEYLRLADRLRPEWLVWENVPGVLSSNGGRDFGSILGGLVELGYGFAYRVLDAQHFGVPQRRRRVFVVGYLGDWRPAAAVLFERHSLQGHNPPSRETGERVARPIAAGSRDGSGYRNDADTAHNLIAGTLSANGKAAGSATSQDARSNLLIASTVSAKWAKGRGGYAGMNETENCVITPMQDPAYALGASPGAYRSYGDGQFNYITHSLRAEGFDASEDGTGRGTPLVPVTVGTLACNAGPNSHDAGNFHCNQAVDAGYIVPVWFSAKDSGGDAMSDLSPTLRAGGHARSHANAGVMPAIAFDTTQITSKANRSNPNAGDACHPLAAGAHAPAIAFQERGRPGGAEPGDKRHIAGPVVAGRRRARAGAQHMRGRGGSPSDPSGVRAPTGLPRRLFAGPVSRQARIGRTTLSRLGK